MRHWLMTTLVSGTVALAAAPAIAQEAGAPAVKSAPAQKAPREGARASGERLEARLAEMKSKLQINAQQEPQWNAFADTLRKQARGAAEQMKARRGRGASASMTAIERLEQRKELLAAASARTDELLAAARPLYAALSPEQQKIADDLIAKRGERRARRGGERNEGQRGRG